MPLVIVARVGAKGEFEVLLQKRHDWLKDPLLWNVPAGSASSDEERVRRDGSTPPELRARIERRSALRELIEKAGGGACSTARAVPHRLEALPGGVAAVSRPPILLPPGLLRMEEDESVVRKLGGGAGNFVYLINPKTEEVWARQWQPRALPRWRDEVYEKAGKWGYAWRPLGCLKASLDLPVPGDDKPLVEWVARHIRGDGLEILLRDLAREAGHGAAPPAAKVRGVWGKKAAGEFSPRSPRDAAAAAFIGGTAGGFCAAPQAPAQASFSPRPVKRCRVLGCTAPNAKSFISSVMGSRRPTLSLAASQIETRTHCSRPWARPKPSPSNQRRRNGGLNLWSAARCAAQCRLRTSPFTGRISACLLSPVCAR